MGSSLPLVLTSLLMGAVTPSGVEIERVIDNASYQPPGLPGQFFIEQTIPLPCDGSVVFAGITKFVSNTALYAAMPDSVETVANIETPIPGTAATFQGAEEPACSGGRIFFAGSEDVTPPVLLGRSIYSWQREDGVVLELVAGIRFGTIEAFSFANPNADGRDFVVQASLRKPDALGGRGLVLKRFSSPPELVANSYQLILPGQTEPPASFSRPFLRGSNVYFASIQFPTSGLYRWSPTEGFSLLVDNQTFYEAAGGPFFGFGDWLPVDGGIVFEASYAAGNGLFLLRDEGTVQPFVVPGDLTSEGHTLTRAGTIRGTGTILTFIGATAESPPGANSVFVRQRATGEVQRILTQGETIEGQPVFTVTAGANGHEAAFLVEHGDAAFSTTIYRASWISGTVEVPTLSLVTAASLAGVLALMGLLMLRRIQI